MARRSLTRHEYRATYYLLRIAIIAAGVLVMGAPVVSRLGGNRFPPSISDSWYSQGQIVFVMGMAAAGCLLAIIRGNTATEQSLLNLGGGCALVVGAAACWPKTEDGRPFAADDYPNDIQELNAINLVVLIILVIAAGLVAVTVPADLVHAGRDSAGAGSSVVSWVIRLLCPIAVAGASVWFFVDQELVARRAHGFAAVLLFLCLGVVAFLRTPPGISLLERLDDPPTGDSVVPRVSQYSTRNGRRWPIFFSATYSVVSIGMLAVVLFAVLMFFRGEVAEWIIEVEFALLLLFLVFWVAQTRDSWMEAMADEAAVAGGLAPATSGAGDGSDG